MNRIISEIRSESVYLRLFHIIFDSPQQVTENDNKNIEVIILIIKNKKIGSHLGGALVTSLADDVGGRNDGQIHPCANTDLYRQASCNEFHR